MIVSGLGLLKVFSSRGDGELFFSLWIHHNEAFGTDRRDPTMLLRPGKDVAIPIDLGNADEQILANVIFVFHILSERVDHAPCDAPALHGSVD